VKKLLPLTLIFSLPITDTLSSAPLRLSYIAATHYFNSKRSAGQKINAKDHAAANQPYLDDAYRSTAKIRVRVPCVTRESMRNRLKHARAT
jgi:hypothetical protein